MQIVRRLRESGFTAYLAGGCVRDDWLGVEPKDFDVATDAKPDQVGRLFPRSRAVGEAFGVMLVRLGGYTTEVATFRTEWGYEDGRRPTQVHFSDAQHDAQRRDFTINGLFEDPLATDRDQRFIDYVGGRRDLDAGVIRAIGDPDQRLAEDYLRMLRAVRFASRLRFEIESHTADAIRKHARDLNRIARERIGQELMGMLTPPALPASPGAGVEAGVDRRRLRAIRLLQDLGLDGPVLLEDPQRVELTTVSGLCGGGPTTVLAAWLLDRYLFGESGSITRPPGSATTEEPQPLVERLAPFVNDTLDHRVRQWRQALCLSNEDRSDLQRTIRLLPAVARWSQLDTAQRKRLLADAVWEQVFALFEALGHQPEVAVMSQRISYESKPLFDSGVAPQPWVDGHDLIAMGHNPGPRFKALLEQAYDAQLDGTVTNRDEALRWLRQKTEGFGPAE